MEAGHSFDLPHTPAPPPSTTAWRITPHAPPPSVTPPPHFFLTITFKCNTPLGVKPSRSSAPRQDNSGARGKAHFTSGPVRATNFDTSRWSVTTHWSFLPLPESRAQRWVQGSAWAHHRLPYSLCHCESLALGLVYLELH